jgi:hypothetical protein
VSSVNKYLLGLYFVQTHLQDKPGPVAISQEKAIRGGLDEEMRKKHGWLVTRVKVPKDFIKGKGGN